MSPRLIVPAFCLLLPLWCAAGADGGEAAEHLTQAVRHRFTVADFVQTRKLSEMDMELKIRGKMIFERGGKLRWQTDAPMRSVTIIEKGRLEHLDLETGKLAVVPQTQFPWLKILRDSLDDWLSGDPERLAGKFETASPEPGVLVLTPRDPEIRKLYRLAVIRFAPDGKTVNSVRIEETSGDVLAIEFLRIRKDPVLPETLWRMPPE